MNYGYFDDKNKEYVITRPDTPTPWINYLSNQNYCALISNCAGGYSFHNDPKDRRILRYRYNNLPYDRPGRYIYIKDTNSDTIWSPSWQPVLTKLDSYKCRHGLGYTIIEGLKDDINTKTTYFVPQNNDLEIWFTEIENKSQETRDITIFTYAEFCLFRAESDQNDLQYIQNVAYTEFENNVIYYSLFDRHPGYVFFTVNEKIDSFDCDREEFIGVYRDESNPIMIQKGKCSNSIALGGNPIAATCINLTLKPDEKRKLIYSLGVSPNKKDILPLIQNFQTPEKICNSLIKLKDFWNQILASFQVKTPDNDFNSIVNIWNPYQCRTTFDWSRYASFYETGIGRGMGFRDSSQDSIGVNYTLQNRVRQRLLDLTKNQFSDGHVYHLYYPLTGEGGFPDYTNPDRPFFSDDHLWLILAVFDYLQETGDLSILAEDLPYVDKQKDIVSFYNHLKQAINFTIIHMGPHDLPLILTADWNDTLHLPGSNNNSESLWVGLQFHLALLSMSKIALFLNEEADSEYYQNQAQKMKTVINEVGWDGEWFIRAFTDSGEAIGSKNNDKGKIFLNPQSWSVLSDITTDDKNLMALNSVQKHLNTKYGVQLLSPPYNGYREDLGGISSFPPSLKENGAIFCHTNPWLILAECKMGRGDLAYQYYNQISPAKKNSIADIHKTEPYVFSQMITGKFHPKFGAAKNSWLTGTAAWTLRSAQQGILGIIPTFEGLMINPCIPKEWDSFSVIRHFRGTIYNIVVNNPSHICKGISKIIVDGYKISNNIIPLFTDKKEHIVEVTMG